MNESGRLIEASRRLAVKCSRLSFSSPVTNVYHPLIYAERPHESYLSLYGNGRKRVVFLGMNPGPWGMAQTGVPFGDIVMVRDWLGVEGTVDKPVPEHPLRPVHGFACSRREVSGQRFWGWVKEHHHTPRTFFRDHFVANYCPCVFLEAGGRNRTPDRIRLNERLPLLSICDEHLEEVVRILDPEWVIGIGRFAENRLRKLLTKSSTHGGRDAPAVRAGGILHPSPASPMANRNWAQQATEQLRLQGVWPMA